MTILARGEISTIHRQKSLPSVVQEPGLTFPKFSCRTMTNNWVQNLPEDEICIIDEVFKRYQKSFNFEIVLN